MTTEPMRDYAKAIAYAATNHAGCDHYRKSTGAPYVTHPLRVAEGLRRHGLPMNAIVAGVLHDVVEDCQHIDIEDIQSRFGDGVASLVAEMTKAPGQTRRDYIDSFATASLDACCIKLADRIDNLSEGGLDEKFMRTYAAESQRLLETIANREDIQCIRGGALRLHFIPTLQKMLGADA